MTRYEPPAGISPSMAAYLSENGECALAFAAGIISLAARGYVRIDASGGQFHLSKVRDADNSVSEEESTLLLGLFPKHGSDDCEFSGTDPGRLQEALREFQETLDDLMCPDLLSPHTVCWITGILFSLAFLPSFAWDIHSASQTSESIGALLYFSIWIVLGAVCLTSAMRLWPAVFRKILSRLPGASYPRHPFEYGDANPVFLSISALFGFALLATQSSPNFALLIAIIVIVSSASRRLLEAPTRKGRKVLSELQGFREFLMRTEADRLSRVGHTQGSPLIFEKFSGYAVALEIERGIGEELATQLMQALEFDHAYSFDFLPTRVNTGGIEPHLLQLNLHGDQENARNFSRKPVR
ncbi:MAG TPA: hypothetical protein VGR72_06960 [Candidatus Acidoferrales bacterium]|nr:hypothetical protein [Candidatus Acidoferrales bacterium]